jgi:hypothetical protein
MHAVRGERRKRRVCCLIVRRGSGFGGVEGELVVMFFLRANGSTLFDTAEGETIRGN